MPIFSAKLSASVDTPRTSTLRCRKLKSNPRHRRARRSNRRCAAGRRRKTWACTRRNCAPGEEVFRRFAARVSQHAPAPRGYSVNRVGYLVLINLPASGGDAERRILSKT